MMNKDLQKTTWQKAMYLIFPVISIGLTDAFDQPPGLISRTGHHLGALSEAFGQAAGENPFMGTYSGQPAPRGDCSGPVLFFRNYFWGDDGMEPVF